MFKLIGSAIILIASALFGTKKYNEFYERKRVLCLIRDGLLQSEALLRCSCSPLYECFLSGGAFFEKAALLIRQGLSPEEAVKGAAGAFHVLRENDLFLIERFAAGLSAQDLEGQLKNVSFFASGLEKNIAEADEDIACRGKLFLKGSLLTAAAVVILLI